MSNQQSIKELMVLSLIQYMKLKRYLMFDLLIHELKSMVISLN